MNIENKIQSILKKLNELKSTNSKFSVFGAKKHKYLFNDVKTELELVKFEEKHKIKLPEGYRQFLLQVGNGGAGPYYGLETLEDSLFIDLDYKRENELLNPSISFPITEPWNMEYLGDHENEKEYKQFENSYFSEKWETGLLRICNFGCGVSLNLVVNGKEFGNIWVDDRGSDGGIYPDPYFEQKGRTNFLDWYLLWLNRTLKELKN